jgi:RNA polymerase sigma factor (sigma-70 family)
MSHISSERTPASLLERVRKTGDTTAWGTFVELYSPLLLAWVRRFGVPPADQPDVVQNVFVVLAVRLPAFEYDRAERFRGFLLKIARDEAVNWFRRARPAGPAVPDLPGGDELQTLIDADHARHVRRLLDRILDTDFDPPTAAAYRRYVFDYLPPAEVAAELGLDVRSVYQAKSRVNRRVRQELDGLLD